MEIMNCNNYNCNFQNDFHYHKLIQWTNQPVTNIDVS